MAASSPRTIAVRRLRRLRILVLAGLGLATAGLTAAVAGVVPGRAAGSRVTGDRVTGDRVVRAPDPFAEPLTTYQPGAAPATANPAGPSKASGQSDDPTPTDDPPVAVSGPS